VVLGGIAVALQFTVLKIVRKGRRALLHALALTCDIPLRGIALRAEALLRLDIIKDVAARLAGSVSVVVLSFLIAVTVLVLDVVSVLAERLACTIVVEVRLLVAEALVGSDCLAIRASWAASLLVDLLVRGIVTGALVVVRLSALLVLDKARGEAKTTIKLDVLLGAEAWVVVRRPLPVTTNHRIKGAVLDTLSLNLAMCLIVAPTLVAVVGVVVLAVLALGNTNRSVLVRLVRLRVAVASGDWSAS
jgi:hypothetical protein